MLRQVAEGVLIHASAFMQSNAVVVQGGAGGLLIDPGVTDSEMACLANDLRELGQPVVAGFFRGMPARIGQDHAYLHALRDAGVPGDPRVGPTATFGQDWLPGVHDRQLQHLAQRRTAC